LRFEWLPHHQKKQVVDFFYFGQQLPNQRYAGEEGGGGVFEGDKGEILSLMTQSLAVYHQLKMCQML